MRAKLRTWMGSWRVWVTIGCLAYIWGVRGRGPAIIAVWPWGLWVAQGLRLLALFFICWIVSEILTRYVFGPLFTVLEGKKLNNRTAKAKEKFADSLMSLSTTLFSAVAISVLVFPLTAFMQAMAKGIDLVETLTQWQPPPWSLWYPGVFIVLYLLPLSLGLLVRRRALDLYDEISPPAPVGAPTAQGPHEQPTVPDPGPPVYVRANVGSRRRRRHRTK
jgi:hypothetical protein